MLVDSSIDHDVDVPRVLIELPSQMRVWRCCAFVSHGPQSRLTQYGEGDSKEALGEQVDTVTRHLNM